METTQLAISVRRARPADAGALADLVNRAYEVEGFFVDGQRTSADEIGRMLSTGAGEFIVLEDSRARLVASVYVEARGDAGGYFGMLSVDPDCQGMGLGTRLVRIAEAMCEAMGKTSVRLKIVNLREELGRWYRSLGYREVGTSPYTHRPVKQPCHFVEMQRFIAAAIAPGERPAAASF
jgi:ribosomal protein S18 acetylase RimI-like enzyme